MFGSEMKRIKVIREVDPANIKLFNHIRFSVFYENLAVLRLLTLLATSTPLSRPFLESSRPLGLASTNFAERARAKAPK